MVLNTKMGEKVARIRARVQHTESISNLPPSTSIRFVYGGALPNAGNCSTSQADSQSYNPASVCWYMPPKPLVHQTEFAPELKIVSFQISQLASFFIELIVILPPHCLHKTVIWEASLTRKFEKEELWNNFFSVKVILYSMGFIYVWKRQNWRHLHVVCRNTSGCKLKVESTGSGELGTGGNCALYDSSILCWRVLQHCGSSSSGTFVQSGDELSAVEAAPLLSSSFSISGASGQEWGQRNLGKSL